jgi:hypothetical protein
MALMPLQILCVFYFFLFLFVLLFVCAYNAWIISLFLLGWFLETGPCCIVQAGIKLLIFLPQLPGVLGLQVVTTFSGRTKFLVTPMEHFINFIN